MTLLALASISIRYTVTTLSPHKLKEVYPQHRIHPPYQMPLNTRNPQPLTSCAADDYLNLLGRRLPRLTWPTITLTCAADYLDSEEIKPADRCHSKITKHYA